MRWRFSLQEGFLVGFFQILESNWFWIIAIMGCTLYNYICVNCDQQTTKGISRHMGLVRRLSEYTLRPCLIRPKLKPLWNNRGSITPKPAAISLLSGFSYLPMPLIRCWHTWKYEWPKSNATSHAVTHLFAYMVLNETRKFWNKTVCIRLYIDWSFLKTTKLVKENDYY